MWEDGERKWNQIRDEKHLGSCPHSCIKTDYAANFSATTKNDKRTMAHTHWFWQMSIRTFCTFPWFLNVHRNIPSFNVDSRTVRKYFHVSPQMGTVCDWHISAHQNAPPERNALTQNKHLTSKPPPDPIQGKLNCITDERQQTPVLQRFQEILEIGLKLSCKKDSPGSPACHYAAALIRIRVSPVFSTLISSSARSLQIETICFLCSIFRNLLMF